MNDRELQIFLAAGDHLFESLERETMACLKNIEAMPVEEIERFIGKREELLLVIQNFDAAFSRHLDRVGRGAEIGAMEKFRRRQGALLSRVIEADGLLLALARIEMTSLKAKQAQISKGRNALQGYSEERGGNMQTSLKRIA